MEIPPQFSSKETELRPLSSVLCASLFSLLVVSSVSAASICQKPPGVWQVSIGEHVVDMIVRNDEFLAITNTGNLLQSKTGKSWSLYGRVQVEDVETTPVFSTLASNGQHLLVTHDSEGVFREEENGRWSTVYVDEPMYKVNVVSNGHNFLALLLSDSSHAFLVASDQSGLLWSRRPLADVVPDERSKDLAFSLYLSAHKEVYLLVGAGLQRSRNGDVWEQVSGANNKVVGRAAWNGKTFVRAANSGRIYLSENGRDWRIAKVTQATSGTSAVRDLEWVREGFFAVGSCARLMSSADGENWVTREAPLPGAPRDRRPDDWYSAIAGTDSGIVAVGHRAIPDENGVTILASFSKDGSEWEDISAEVISTIADQHGSRRP